MTEEAREDVLGRFSEGNSLDLSEIIHMDMEGVEDKNVLGFCVMGGIFSEGIDLKYDSLIGVIVVGTGIPMVCNEREVIRNYFDQKLRELIISQKLKDNKLIMADKDLSTIVNRLWNA